MRERTSDGTRFMGTNEFLHSRIVANAVEVSWSSWETASEVNLGFEEAINAVSLQRLYYVTYDEQYATRLSSSFRAKTSCESERPWPG